MCVCLKIVNPDPCGDSGSERLLNNSGIFDSQQDVYIELNSAASIQNIPLVWRYIGQCECVWALDTEVFPEFCVFMCMSWVCILQLICLNVSLSDFIPLSQRLRSLRNSCELWLTSLCSANRTPASSVTGVVILIHPTCSNKSQRWLKHHPPANTYQDQVLRKQT